MSDLTVECFTNNNYDEVYKFTYESEASLDWDLIKNVLSEYNEKLTRIRIVEGSNGYSLVDSRKLLQDLPLPWGPWGPRATILDTKMRSVHFAIPFFVTVSKEGNFRGLPRLKLKGKVASILPSSWNLIPIEDLYSKWPIETTLVIMSERIDLEGYLNDSLGDLI